MAEAYRAKIAAIRELPLPSKCASLRNEKRTDAVMFDHVNYGARALTRISVVQLPRKQVLSLADRYPAIGHGFIWLAMVEDALWSDRACSLDRRSAVERMAHLLCELSVRLGQDEADEACCNDKPLSQEKLADVLWLTSFYVKRILQSLRRDGIIVLERRTTAIAEVSRLHRCGGFDPGHLPGCRTGGQGASFG